MAQPPANINSAAQPPARSTRVYYGLVGLVALAVGVWQIQTSLHLPLGLNSNSEATNTSQSSAPASPNAEALKHQDSDGDGLSDYDELYLYHTSPYLKDTDSDGYDDKTEVTSGNDPLCAHGQTCTAPTFATADQGPAAGGPQLPANLTASELRAYLKQAGVSEAELAKYDDASLLQLYRQLAATDSGTAASGSTAPPASPALTQAQRDELSKLSGQELRQFLVHAGIAAATLDKYDDATLKALVLDMLSSSVSTPTTPSP